MNLIVSGKRAPRVVFPLLGIVLLLALACSTAAPPVQETSGNENTAPAGSQAETTDSPLLREVTDAQSEEATPATPSDNMQSGSSEEPSSAAPANGVDSSSSSDATVSASSEETNAESMGVSDNVGHEVGQQVPDFSMTLVDGSTVTGAGLIAEGQPTFLFFFETWCGTCRRELNLMKEVYPDYADQVHFYAIGATPVDTLDGLESFRQEQGHPWPVASADSQVLRDLHVPIRSTKIAFGRDGIITYRATFGQANEDVWREVFEELSSQS